MYSHMKTKEHNKRAFVDEIPKASRLLNLSQEKNSSEPIVNTKLIRAKSQICSLLGEEDIFKQTKNESKETERIFQMKTELRQILHKDNNRINKIPIPSSSKQNQNQNDTSFNFKVRRKIDSHKENISLNSNGKFTINKTTIFQ